MTNTNIPFLISDQCISNKQTVMNILHPNWKNQFNPFHLKKPRYLTQDTHHKPHNTSEKILNNFVLNLFKRQERTRIKPYKIKKGISVHQKENVLNAGLKRTAGRFRKMHRELKQISMIQLNKVKDVEYENKTQRL